MKTNKTEVILENWSIGGNYDIYTPPELIRPRLQGKVFNHPNPKHFNGKFVVTSQPVGQRNGRVITKSGTEYTLGKVDPEFEKLFPNARERVFKNLPKV